YSLWEVIINGDSLVPTIVVDGVVQLVSHKSAEQKVARRNELKARDTLLMALPDKHQLQKLVSQLEIQEVSLSQEDVNLKFLRCLPSEWKTHTLKWRNKANLEEHSLDDLFNSLKIYKAKVKHSSSPGNPTQNLAFVSSFNTDSTTDSVSAATGVSAVCAKLHVSSHPNIDSFSNAVIFSFFVSQSISPQLYNEDLKHIDHIDVDDLEEMDLRWQMAMLTMGARRSRSVEARLVVYKQNESILEENIKLLNVEVQARDTALVSLRQKLNQAELERDDLKLKLDKFQTSSKNLTELLASQTNEKHDLGYCSLESDCETLSPSSLSDRLQPNGGYHILSPSKPAQDLSHTTRPLAPIIEDWVSDSEDEFETNDPQSVPSFVQSCEQVKTPRHSVQPVKGKIVGILDLMIQKSNRMKQKDQSRHCETLQAGGVL
nr:hypothetical protein [Tanacetum cinerariifolium]